MEKTNTNKNKSMSKKFLVLVSGMAGAGKTDALQCFEDMGYDVVDNMPLRLMPALLADTNALPERMALGMDIRNHDIATHYGEAIDAIRGKEDINSHLLFLTASDDVLLKYFQSSHRRHPLAVGRPLNESISLERQILSSLKSQADSELETSGMTFDELKRMITTRFASGDETEMQVFVMSFGFKHGLPREVDTLFDVRFLQNPYWVPELRHKTGLEQDIVEYIQADPEYDEAFSNMQKTLTHQLRLFQKADRRYVTIAIGCTGGRHRSVVMSQQISASLKASGFKVKVHHRNLQRKEDAEAAKAVNQ